MKKVLRRTTLNRNPRGLRFFYIDAAESSHVRCLMIKRYSNLLSVARLSSFIVAVFLSQCQNYNLLEKIENPGKAFSPQKNLYRIFLTAATYTGNLSGVSGADAKCMSDGNRPDNSIYKALITDGTSRRACSGYDCVASNADQNDWVLKPSMQYINGSNQPVFFTNVNGTIDANAFPLTNALGGGKNLWTGFTVSWSVSSICQVWTSANVGDYGVYGVDTNVDMTFLNSGAIMCNSTQSLYCVEQ